MSLALSYSTQAAAVASSTEKRTPSSDVENPPPVSESAGEKEKDTTTLVFDGQDNFYDDLQADPAPTNNGVRKVEASQAVWGRRTRWCLFGALSLATYVCSLDVLTSYQYLFFATSNANNHALTGTVTTAASIIISVGRPLMAKLADTLGRAETYCIVIFLYMLGYVLLGYSNTVGQISAGTIIYSLGYSGLDLLTTIIVADATTLRWRGLITGVMSMPYVINSFISAEIIEGLVPGRWRIGYFMLVVLVPVCLSPVVGILLWSQGKAKKLQLICKPTTRDLAAVNKPVQTVKRFFSEMDIVGLVLVCGSFSSLLVPLGVAGRTASVEGWKDPGNLTMIVLGVCLFPALCLWEWKYAAHPLAPKRFFKNKNIVASFTIVWLDFVSSNVVYTYQYSFILLVKSGVWSERSISYFSNTLTVGLCVFAIPTGAFMAWTRRYKWFSVVGLLIRLLGVGVMIKSRSAEGTDFELVACQILQGLGGAITMTTAIIASQAGVIHADVGAITALLALIGGIGNAFGSTIATAVWVNQYQKALMSNLPQLSMTEILTYYASPVDVVVLSVNDPIRQGVTASISGIMKTMCIIATVIAALPPFIAAFVLEDLVLGDVQNTIEGRDLQGNKVVDFEGAGRTAAVAREKEAKIKDATPTLTGRT